MCIVEENTVVVGMKTPKDRVRIDPTMLANSVYVISLG